MENPLNERNANKLMINKLPNKPSSSLMAEKIKSDIATGTIPGLPNPGPDPIICPAASA